MSEQLEVEQESMNENLESRGPLSDEPRGNQDGAAPRVGELEWRDSYLNREGSGLMFEAVSSGEQMWWVVKDFEDDTWYLTNDWMSDELRIGPLFKTKDEAQSLANSLQRILSGAAEEGL